MPCNNCNHRNCNGCEVEVHICNQCPPEQPCSCEVKDLSTDCILYTQDPIECNDVVVVPTNTILSDALNNIVSWTCTKFSEVQNFFTLKNVGTGAGVYKGINLLGEKELKSITKTGSLVTITPSTNEINFTIDEDELINIIEEQLPPDVCIESESLVITELDGCFQAELEVVSDTLTVTQESPGVIRVEQPTITDIPRFIVNSAYTGVTEEGTLSRPFKTIQVAVTAYIGTGTSQAPQFINAEIIIQKGSGYTYTGDFSFNTGTGSIILEEGTVVTSNPTGDRLCDLDVLSDTESASFSMVLKDGARLILSKSGFRNRGTTVDNSAFTDVKQVNITGTGRISQNSTSLTNTYTIFESNYTANDTYNNDGASPYNVRGVAIATNTQSIHKIGGNSRIDYTDCQTITINAITGLSTSTVFFNQIGGIVNISNTALSISPFFAITLDKIFPVSKSVGIPCTLQITNTSINGRMTTFVSNETSEQSSVNISNITSQRNLLTCVNVAKSASVVWTNFIALNCVFASGEVDQVQVDLTAGNTISTTNIFALKVVESLQVFASRALAVSSGSLKKGNAFINRKTVVAGSFVVGEEYSISSVGSTDFTTIGASANTIGVNFTATGVGSGSGEAYSYKRDILI